MPIHVCPKVHYTLNDMGYDTFLARSFGKIDQRRMSYGALLCCFLCVLSICVAFDRSLGPVPAVSVDLQFSKRHNHELLRVQEQGISQEQEQEQGVVASIANVTMNTETLCNTTEPRSEYCNLKGDARIIGRNSTVFITSSWLSSRKGSWSIRPYARKGDANAMKHVREWSVLATVDDGEMPQCTQNHAVPAVLFSLGAFSMNNYHAFTDIIIPLFITSREFQGEVQFLVTDNKPRWTAKFRKILENLSRYELIDIDKAKEDVHCFPRAIIGVKHHKEMTIDPSRSPYSMIDFKKFLRSAYSLNRDRAIRIRDSNSNGKKPRLLIITRKRTRSFTNEPEIIAMAENLGYEVIAAEAEMNMSKTSKLVNSCDVMMGVHGAGLTNYVFLPENAVFIQILPLGGLKWIAKTCFGNPAKHLNISYLEYNIMEKESSLIQQFPLDHVVLKDPVSFHKHDWLKFKSIYLDKQNVELDVNRFRDTLLKALELLY